MKGIQFLVDEQGDPISVVIDLDVHFYLWEDIFDCLMVEATRDEPTIPWEEIKAEMDAELVLQQKMHD